MSTVCYCGQPDCPVTTWERDACVANLRAERDELKATLRLVRDWTEPYRGAPPMTTDELHNHVLAVLAKHPEGKR